MHDGEHEHPQRAAKAALLRRPRQLVIKIGSSVLADDRGISHAQMDRLAAEIAGLRRGGLCVTVVSSGAIAAGRAALGMPAARSIPERQAAAAVGQIILMAEYQRAFGLHGVKVAQILLDAEDLASRRRYLNAEHTVASLHAGGILPIVNENDTVAIDELKFGDNDNLSALVATLVAADLLVILSDVGGLFSRNPRVVPEAERIPLVTRVDAAVLERAGGAHAGADHSGGLGTGGMSSKLLAARKAAAAGIATVIADGRVPGTLERVLDVGCDVGTLVLPQADRLARRKHWIAYSSKPAGTLTCDAGATAAVVDRGRSLLPSGIVAVSGRFEAGDCVSLATQRGDEFARGLASYSAGEIARIAGKRSSEVEQILGFKMGDAVVHRNDLVLTGRTEAPARSRLAAARRSAP
jgi:glutamate 5-kinase